MREVTIVKTADGVVNRIEGLTPSCVSSQVLYPLDFKLGGNYGR